jgi:hypothetical protein
VPRRIDAPHPWRSALIIFGVFILLAIVSGLVIRYAFTPYKFIDNLPQSSER